MSVERWALSVERFFSGDEPVRQPLAHPRERRVRIRQLEQPRFRVADRQPQPVVLRRLIERRHSPRPQALLQRARAADRCEHADGGNVQRIRERHPVSQRAVATMAVILGPENSGRRRKGRRHVRDDRRGCGAALDREEVGERLERRACRAPRPRAVHLAGAGREIILRTDQREHVAACVVDQDGGRLVNVLRVQPRELIAHGVFDEAIEIEIERRPHGRGVRRRQFAQHEIDEVRRAKEPLRRLKVQRLRAGARGLRSGEPAGFLHSREDDLLAAFRRAGGAMRIQPRRVFWQPGEERRLRVAQVREWFAEVVIRGGSDADVEVAEVEPVEIRGEDLLLRPHLFEPHGAHGFEAFRRERAWPRIADFHELLRDGGCARGDSMVRRICPERPPDREEIDAAVVEETFVFRGEHRVQELRRDFVERDLAGEAFIDTHLAQRDAVAICQLAALHRRPQQRRRQRHELQPEPGEQQRHRRPAHRALRHSEGRAPARPCSRGRAKVVGRQAVR